MDKIRFSVTGQSDDFTRLYNWGRGFVGELLDVSFEGDKALNMALVYCADYAVSVSGDAGMTVEQLGACSFIKFYTITWSDAARATGQGTATVTLVHPDYPDEPAYVRLTLGAFANRSTQVHKASDVQPGDDFGQRQMIMQEMAHAMMRTV